MKTIEATLLAHQALPVTSVCLLAKVECKGAFAGQVYGFTNLDVNRVYNDGAGAITYVSDNGFTPKRVARSSAMGVDNSELDGLISASGITEAKVRAGMFRGATVTVYRVNWNDLTTGRQEVVDYGKAGETRYGQNAWTTEFLSLSALLGQPIGETYGIDCPAQFGDARCGKAFVWTAGSVTSLGSDTKREFGDTASVEAAGFYTLGVIRFLTGLNTGHQMEIEAHALGAFELSLDLLPFPIAIADTYERRQDCDKKFATCRDVHANTAKFRGFNLMPVDGTPMVPGAEIKRA